MRLGRMEAIVALANILRVVGSKGSRALSMRKPYSNELGHRWHYIARPRPSPALRNNHRTGNRADKTRKKTTNRTRQTTTRNTKNTDGSTTNGRLREETKL